MGGALISVPQVLTGKRQGLIGNRLLIRSLIETSAGQVVCKLQFFDSLSRIVEL